jgi:alpha-tubulin suppressor-like RCC1 family protein
MCRWLTVLLMLGVAGTSMASITGNTLDLTPKAPGTGIPCGPNPGGRIVGDTIADPLILAGLGTVTGTTVGFFNDYEEACPYAGSAAPDVVYLYTHTDPGIAAITLDLCHSSYDTKLFVYDNAYTPGAPYACNDDYNTGAPCTEYTSKIVCLPVTVGHSYYVVIDGYGSASGAYQLDVTACEPPPTGACCGYSVGHMVHAYQCEVRDLSSCEAGGGVYKGDTVPCLPNPCLPYDVTTMVVPFGDNRYGQCTVPSPNEEWVATSAGGGHTLGLKSDGTIVAWGYNGYGACTVPAPNAGFVACSAGRDHSLGLKSDGTIVAWGKNDSGQSNPPTPNAGFEAIAGGYAHSLGLKSDGTIVAWGSNTSGQCNVPVPNTGFVAMAAGGSHSLGLKSDGTIVAWGSNSYGQRTVPAPNANFVAVSAGLDHCLGLKSDGTIVAWGSNFYGQCTLPAPNAGYVAVAAGFFHSLGLKSDGTIVAWGYNGNGQCNLPTPNADFAAIAAGHMHSVGLMAQDLWIGACCGYSPGHLVDMFHCEIMASSPCETGGGSFKGDGEPCTPNPCFGLSISTVVTTFGSNSDGQCNPPLNPLLVAVEAGYRHSLGIKSDGTIIAWGWNDWGQCNVPTPNAGFLQVDGGYGHTLGLKSDGTIIAWGRNSDGECNIPSPNRGFEAVAAALTHSLGLKSDGTIVAWGRNDYGQCIVPSPNAGFVAVTSGYYHSMGLKSDGTIVAWGDNEEGQCNIPSPNAGFVAIAGGRGHSMGLKMDGTIIAWGRNTDGECNVPSPNAGFVGLAAGDHHSLGLKSDGTIVAWGNNGDGQCNVPPPNAGVFTIAAGAIHSLALRLPDPAGVDDPVPQVASGTERLRILSVMPNPITSSAQVCFESREPGSVSLTAHDVGGRQVMTSALGSFEPGRHQVRWEARDAAGRKLTAGVYFLRLQDGAGGQSRTRVLLLH